MLRYYIHINRTSKFDKSRVKVLVEEKMASVAGEVSGKGYGGGSYGQVDMEGERWT